LKVSNHMVSQV